VNDLCVLTWIHSCPSKAQCYSDVYNIEYQPESEWDWSLPEDGSLGEDPFNDDLADQKENENASSSPINDDADVIHGVSAETDEDQFVVNDDLSNS